jgi:hypothetical protein
MTGVDRPGGCPHLHFPLTQGEPTSQASQIAWHSLVLGGSAPAQLPDMPWHSIPRLCVPDILLSRLFLVALTLQFAEHGPQEPTDHGNVEHRWGAHGRVRSNGMPLMDPQALANAASSLVLVTPGS